MHTNNIPSFNKENKCSKQKNPIISALHVPFPFREEFSRSPALIFRGGNLSFPHFFPAIKKSRKKKIFHRDLQIIITPSGQ
jgi:hypothetical protein